MAAFIDDIIIGTEDEREHDELVVKVVKKLVKWPIYEAREMQVES